MVHNVDTAYHQGAVVQAPVLTTNNHHNKASLIGFMADYTSLSSSTSSVAFCSSSLHDENSEYFTQANDTLKSFTL